MTHRHLAAAALAVPFFLTPAVLAGDCCSGESACSDTKDATVQIDADVEKATPEELQAKIEGATNREEAIAAVREYVDTHPKHERSAEYFYGLAMISESAEEKKAYFGKLVEHHPESQFAEMASGEMEKLAKIGKPFELTFDAARTGETISVQDDLKGKVVVIDFWATWCGPCIAEMPKMKKLYAEYKDRGVEFIGVSLDSPVEQGGRDKLLAYVEEENIPWPQYYQGNGWQSEFSKSWGINSIPAIFIVDADGKLHSTNARGQLDKLIPELLDARDAKQQASAQ